MASSQRSVPASVPPVAARSAQPRPATARTALSGRRGPQAVAPGVARRDAVRPGVRPGRLDGRVAARPVRGGCAADAGPPRPAGSDLRDEWSRPAPLRLTERGRRVIAGLSIAIGLSIAAATVVTVQLDGEGDGLQLAGSSTVVVQPGDTLWSIARRLAPEEDTRAVVDAIVDRNGLDGVDLLPGAVLELP